MADPADPVELWADRAFLRDDPGQLVAATLAMLPGGLFRITTDAGCLVCA